MFGRVIMFIVMAFLGLIGISVNFRKDGSHNPFKLSMWGYIFFAIGVLGFSMAVHYQIEDYQANQNTEAKLNEQHITDSLKREFDKKELELKLEQQRIMIDALSGKLDEKDSVNRFLISQNVVLIKTGNKIQQGEQGVLDQSKELIGKVDDYQKQLALKEKRIDYLRKSVSAAKRGMYKTVSFKGIISTGNQGGGVIGSAISSGKEEAFFNKLVNAEKAGGKQLLKIANEGIGLNPDWMTPYLFKASALWNLKQREEALQLFLMVEENTIGDPEYANVLANFYNSIGDKEKVKQLQDDFKSLH